MKMNKSIWEDGVRGDFDVFKEATLLIGLLLATYFVLLGIIFGFALIITLL